VLEPRDACAGVAWPYVSGQLGYPFELFDAVEV
jgi:hypothetical protein